MGKDKSEKKDRKEKKEKKEKKVAEDGVKKSKKDKKDGSEVTAALEQQLERTGDLEGSLATTSAEVVLGALVPFANPLADEKQTKTVLKNVKKATKAKTLKRGVKEVVKSLRKSPTSAPSSSDVSNPLGVVVLAADISPMDVISHIPVLCEDHNIPYIYVRSRAELGAASATKRPTSVVMVGSQRDGKQKEKVSEDDKKEFEEAYKGLVDLVRKASASVKV